MTGADGFGRRVPAGRRRNRSSVTSTQCQSLGVKPPSSSVRSLRVTVFQRTWISGWWFQRSASRATRRTHRIACWKSAKRSSRTSQLRLRFHAVPGRSRVEDFGFIYSGSLTGQGEGSRSPGESSYQSSGDNLPIAVEKIPNNPRGWVPHGLFPEPFTDRVVGIWPSMLVFLMVVRVVHDGY